MTPIIGILASSSTSSFLGNYESIATVTVGAGGSASVTFSSISSDYTHLQIRYFGYSTRTNIVLDTYDVRLGTGSIDTSASYSYHNLYGDGDAAGVTAASSTTTIQPVFCVGDENASSQRSGVGVIDILDYKNTNKYKTVRILGGFDINGKFGSGTQYGGRVGLTSGLWQKTTAVNTITLFPTNGSWGQYSHFALYGIK
jgi:hypothetical protein